jgi:hypothetical protein
MRSTFDVASNVQVAGGVTVLKSLQVGAAIMEAPSPSSLDLTGVSSLTCEEVVARQFRTASDRRLKFDIRRDRTDEELRDLTKLMRVSVSSFKFRGRSSPKKGLIAQEFERHFPDAVGTVDRFVPFAKGRVVYQKVIEGEGRCDDHDDHDDHDHHDKEYRMSIALINTGHGRTTERVCTELCVGDRISFDEGGHTSSYLILSVSRGGEKKKKVKGPGGEGDDQNMIYLHVVHRDKKKKDKNNNNSDNNLKKNAGNLVNIYVSRGFKVVDYDYLSTVMLNAIKCLNRKLAHYKTGKRRILLRGLSQRGL